MATAYRLNEMPFVRLSYGMGRQKAAQVTQCAAYGQRAHALSIAYQCGVEPQTNNHNSNNARSGADRVGP